MPSNPALGKCTPGGSLRVLAWQQATRTNTNKQDARIVRSLLKNRKAQGGKSQELASKSLSA